MEQLDKQQELKLAMNGRMGLMMGGILLAATALTSTLSYGFNIFTIAKEAAKGTEECVEILQSVQMSVTVAYITAVLFIIVAVAELFTGVFCLRLCNRVDKAKVTKKIILGLLAVEIIMQVFLLLTRMLNLGMLFTAIAIPLFMLWGAARLAKLAQADPERIYAIDTKKAKEQRTAAKSAPQAPVRSLRERAMMQAADIEAEPEDTQTEPESEEANSGIFEDTETEPGASDAETKSGTKTFEDAAN